MQYDYFIASRWRNRDRVQDLVQKLRDKDKRVYSFFEAPDAIERVADDPEAIMAAFEEKDWENDTSIKKIFEHDMEAERNSETLIMLLPAGKSAHIEAGVAYGLGKKCILIGEQEKAESLYLIFDEHYPSIDSFIESLS